MSLESLLQETKQQYHDKQKQAARENEEARTFGQRVVVRLRTGVDGIEHVADLRQFLPEAGYLHVEALRRAYPDMERLVLAPNVSSYSSLGGHVLVFNPTQPLSQLAHVVNVKSPFGVTMAVGLRDAKYTSARDFRERYGSKLAECIGDLAKEGPSMETHWTPDSPEDAQRWQAFFPARRTHVGVYADEDNKMYLVMRSHAGENVLSGVRAVLAEADMTAGRFVEDSRIKWMQDLAYRNVARVLHTVAKTLGFDTPSTHDYKSYSGPERRLRYRAVVPDIVSRHDTQRMTKMWGEPRAVFFRDVIDGSQGRGDAVLVRGDVSTGYALADIDAPVTTDTPVIYPMTTDKIAPAERQSLTADQRDQVTSKISSMLPRSSSLTHRKYHSAPHASVHARRQLSPIAVVRS